MDLRRLGLALAFGLYFPAAIAFPASQEPWYLTEYERVRTVIHMINGVPKESIHGELYISFDGKLEDFVRHVNQTFFKAGFPRFKTVLAMAEFEREETCWQEAGYYLRYRHFALTTNCLTGVIIKARYVSAVERTKAAEAEAKARAKAKAKAEAARAKNRQKAAPPPQNNSWWPVFQQ